MQNRIIMGKVKTNKNEFEAYILNQYYYYYYSWR